MDRIKIAVIGAGAMARRHLEVLRTLQGAEIAAASSRSQERLRKLAADFQIPEIYQNNEQMLDKVGPDAVVVAVSAADIYRVSSSSIRRGIPTLLEKPPGLTAQETESLLESTNHQPVQCMVGLNRRFYSVINNAKTLVQESGALVSVLIQAPEDMAAIKAMNLHPPEVLNHWMAANGIHGIDLLRFLGGEVKSVQAFSRSHGASREGYGALIHFENGAIGHYVSNWASPGRWQIALYGMDMRVDLQPWEEGTMTLRDGSTSQVPKDDVDNKFKPGFYGQDSYFIEHVRNNLPISRPAANIEDALATMRLVEAIANS